MRRHACLVITALGAGACGRVNFDGSSSSASMDSGSASTSAYASAVIADGPIAYYRFAEQVGSVARDELGRRPATYAATGVTLGVAGALAGDSDPAVELDGSTGRIDFGDEFAFSSRQPFTIEVWVKPNIIGPDVRFVFAREPISGTGSGYHLYFNMGAPAWTLFTRSDGAQTSYADAGGLVDGRFQHLVASYDGALTRTYVDGVLIDQVTSNVDITLATAGAFALGDNANGIYYKFDGAFDELAIYDRALLDSEIQDHFAVARSQ